MLKPYDVPLLPILFDIEMELIFYKQVVDASIEIEKSNYSTVNESFYS